MCRVIKDKFITTRKDHICDWCGETIDTGSKAHYSVIIMDDLITAYMHCECNAAALEAVYEYDIQGCWTYYPFENPRGGFREDSICEE